MCLSFIGHPPHAHDVSNGQVLDGAYSLVERLRVCGCTPHRWLAEVLCSLQGCVSSPLP